MEASTQSRAFWIFGYGSLIWKPDVVYDESFMGELPGYVRRFWQSSPDHRGTPQQPGRVCTLVPVLCNCPSLPDESLRPSSVASPICAACHGHSAPPVVAAGLGVAAEPGAASSPWGLLTSNLSAGETPVVRGTAYHVPAEHAAEQLAKLLHRESAGYDVVEAGVLCEDGAVRRALVFTATPENEHWAGPPGATLAACTTSPPGKFSRSPDLPSTCACDGDAGVPWDVREVGAVIARSVGPSGRNTEYLARLTASLAARGHPDPYLERLSAAVGAATAPDSSLAPGSESS